MTAKRVLVMWALALFLGMMIFQFLHECGHGFGAQLDGTHVSTGFNRVGDPGKRPSEPDFRSEKKITGVISSGGLLGPFTNWMLAIIFTVWLWLRKNADVATILIGAGAVTNAMMRLLAMSLFIVGAVSGRVHLEDEVGWGLGAIQRLTLPMPFNDFRILTRTDPVIFLSEPRFYFWPVLSFGIVFSCFVLSYRRLYAVLGPGLSNEMNRWAFGLMPVAVIPPMYLLCSWLDNLVRINW